MAEALLTTWTLVAASHDLPSSIAISDVSATTAGSRHSFVVHGSTQFEALVRCLAITRAAISRSVSTRGDAAREELEAERARLAAELASLDESLRELAVEESVQVSTVAVELGLVRVQRPILERIRGPEDLAGEEPPMLRMAAHRVREASRDTAALQDEGFGPRHPHVVLAQRRTEEARARFESQREAEVRWLRAKEDALTRARPRGGPGEARLVLLKVLLDELERPGLGPESPVVSELPLTLRLIAREVGRARLEDRGDVTLLGPKHPARIAREAQAAEELASAQRDFERERILVAAMARRLLEQGMAAPAGSGADPRSSQVRETERHLATVVRRLQVLDQPPPRAVPRASVVLPCRARRVQ
ncbi:MAG: hypothetical protein WKG00_10185 [Polyangiaceae bacterium]